MFYHRITQPIVFSRDSKYSVYRNLRWKPELQIRVTLGVSLEDT